MFKNVSNKAQMSLLVALVAVFQFSGVFVQRQFDAKQQFGPATSVRGE